MSYSSQLPSSAYRPPSPKTFSSDSYMSSFAPKPSYSDDYSQQSYSSPSSSSHSSDSYMSSFAPKPSYSDQYSQQNYSSQVPSHTPSDSYMSAFAPKPSYSDQYSQQNYSSQVPSHTPSDYMSAFAPKPSSYSDDYSQQSYSSQIPSHSPKPSNSSDDSYVSSFAPKSSSSSSSYDSYSQKPSYSSDDSYVSSFAPKPSNSSYSSSSSSSSSYDSYSQKPSSSVSSDYMSSFAPRPSNSSSTPSSYDSYSQKPSSSDYVSSFAPRPSNDYSQQSYSAPHAHSSSLGVYSPQQQRASSAYDTSSASTYPLSNSPKRAVVVGICYFSNRQARLNGSLDDARTMKKMLMSKFGFAERDILVLMDVPNIAQSQRPTRANIINALKWLTGKSQPGESLFFFYSGHGSQTEDLNGDETDGMDETLLPEDYQSAGSIVDDELYAMLAAPLPRNAKLTCFFDCCHSGTGLDLPYVYVNGRMSQERTAKRDTQGEVFLISGCADDQTSKDGRVKGNTKSLAFSGVMTSAFCQAVDNSSQITYGALIQSMRKFCFNNGSFQTIQLTSGKMFDLNTPFSL